MRVVIIDDFPTMRKILRSLLEQLKHEVSDECEGVEDALACIEVNPPDLVISDITIRGGGVSDLLQRLKTINMNHIPVLLMCSDSEKRLVDPILQNDIQGVLVKPFSVGILSERMKKLIAEEKVS